MSNIRNLILLFLIVPTVVKAESITMSNKLDNVYIHYFHSKEIDGKPIILTEKILIYKDMDLSKTPVFEIDGESITDLKNNQKRYFFRENYKYIKRPSQLEDDVGYLYKVTNLPIEFIKASKRGFVIPVESRINDILKVDGQELYFKRTPIQLREFGIDWQRDVTLEPIKKLKKEDVKFSNFMNEFERCVKIKSKECLLKLHKGFEVYFYQWTLLNDPKLCGKVDSDDPNLPNMDETRNRYIVNWALYEKFLELKSADIESKNVISDFGDYYHLDVTASGEDICNYLPTFHLTVSKIKSEKIDKIEIAGRENK